MSDDYESVANAASEDEDGESPQTKGQSGGKPNPVSTDTIHVDIVPVPPPTPPAPIRPMPGVSSSPTVTAMAEGGEVPEGMNDWLNTPNPSDMVQAQVGDQLAPATQAIAQSVESGPAVSKAPMEGVEPDPIGNAVLDAGVLGGVGALGDAGEVVGNEIGSIGRNVKPLNVGKGIKLVDEAPQAIGKVTNDIKQSGQALTSEGVSVPMVQGKPNLGSVTSGYSKPIKSELITPEHFQNLKNKKYFAEGGEVEAPGGMDQWLGQSPEGNTSSNEEPASNAPSDGEPEGINHYLSDELLQEKHGGLGQQVQAGVEGAAQGILGPIAPYVEKKTAGLFGQPEAETESNIRGRAEANPWTHGLGEVAGLGASMMTGVGEGALALKAGEAVGNAMKLSEASGAAKIGGEAVKAAIENMIIGGSDETSKMILHDPNQSAQTAVTDIGLAGLLGAALGGGLSATGKLWDATVGTKMGQAIEDFKGRMQEHFTNPDPVHALTEEMSNHYNGIKSVSDEVYGPKGLKAEEIAKTMPEMSEGMSTQVQKTADTLQSQIKKMVADQHSYPPRLTTKLQGDLDAYVSKVSTPEVTPKDLFNATQDLKQSLQGYSKFDSFVKPVDEAYDFVKDSKTLARGLRESLEDKAVWGKAAERQQAINKAFVDFKPALKDFEKKFTTEVSGERVIDPTKINTYVNQAGKPNAEIKQEMLKNWLDASQKYAKVIDDTHANLGLESLVPSSTHLMNSSLNKLTPGAKLADLLIKKGFSDIGGKTLGAAVGGALGHTAGVGQLGAIVGAHAMGPFFSSVLPAITKPILEGMNSTKGFKAAVDYGVQVAKGEALMTKSVKNMFKDSSSVEVLPESKIPTEKDRSKLLSILKAIKADPMALVNIGKDTGHYLPGHTVSLGQTAGNAVNFLDSARPDVDRKNPLDSKLKPSTTQKAGYDRVLDIAQQPLIVLNHIKKGTLTSKDVTAMKTLYPDLYNRLNAKITTQIIDSVAKKQNIPYKTRQSLSLFLATPLDSTMIPSSIMAAQPMPQAPNTQQQSQRTPSESKMKGLNKMPGMYQTPGQARQQRSQKQ